MLKPNYDTTEHIWDFLFSVSIPYLASRSIEELRQNGTFLSGIQEVDEDIANQWMNTMMSIADLVELHKEGVPIRVRNETDTKLMYEYISEHIHAWKTRLEVGINIGDAPIDDLIAMDEFANTVYGQAKYLFTEEIADSLLLRNMSTTSSISPGSFFNKPVETEEYTGEDGVVRINGVVPEIDDRDSLSDFFKNRLITIGRR